MVDYVCIVLTTILVARRKRKIFRIRGLPERFRELAGGAFEEGGFHMRACLFHDFYVVMELELPFKASARDAVNCVRRATSLRLRMEFSEVAAESSLWERTYYAASGTIRENEATLRRFHASLCGNGMRKETGIAGMFTEEMIRKYLRLKPRYEPCELSGYVTYYVYVGTDMEFVDGYRDSAYMVFCNCPAAGSPDVLAQARLQEEGNAPPFRETVAELTRQLNATVYGVGTPGSAQCPDAAIALQKVYEKG